MCVHVILCPQPRTCATPASLPVPRAYPRRQHDDDCGKVSHRGSRFHFQIEGHGMEGGKRRSYRRSLRNIRQSRENNIQTKSDITHVSAVFQEVRSTALYTLLYSNRLEEPVLVVFTC